MNIIEKQVKFTDSHGNEQKAIISFRDELFLDIKAFNKENKPTGYMSLYFHSSNRLYLNVIYCYDEFRGLGIATAISNLADYILRDYAGAVIRGAYEPGQLSTDRENKIERSYKDLDARARNFYAKAGYEIVKYEEYLENKEKYPYLNIEDFYLGEDGPTTIVAKPIVTKKHPFSIDDVICHTNCDKIKIKLM